MDADADGQHRDGPTGPPVDVEEERQRLLATATARGVDAGAAVELAERIGRGEPLPDAFRAVERRIATGATVDEAEAILLGDPDKRPGDDIDASQ
jgi:hypothetical protein